MNIVILEDEPMTAEDLADILGGMDSSVRIVSILHSVKDAIAYFKEVPFVDLVFSDIQLGDGLSFEVFKSVRVDAPVIFCTAFDEYAMDAIKNNGIEYILKPFNRASVIAAVNRYNHLKRQLASVPLDYDKMIRLITDGRGKNDEYTSVLVYQKDKVLPVEFKDIALIYIDGDVIRLHCFTGKSFIAGQSLEELESMAKSQFFRVNRQYLVNRRAIVDATHYIPRKFVLNLSIQFKEAIVVSKNRTTLFLQWLALS